MTDTEEMVAINNIEELGGAVITWHENMVQRIQHYIHIPTGGTITINDVAHPLEGDFLEGFVAAMQVLYTEMVNNPPIVETSDEPAH
jgi:hypothetical protein